MPIDKEGRDTGRVWDSASGGWTTPKTSGQAAVRPDPGGGQWRPETTRPYIDPRTGRWVGGLHHGEVFRDEKRTLISVGQMVVAGALLSAVAIGLLTAFSNQSSKSVPLTQTTPVTTPYLVPAANGGTPIPVPTDTPFPTDTPAPTSAAAIPPSSLPQDFTN